MRRYFSFLFFLVLLSSCQADKNTNKQNDTLPSVTIQKTSGPVSFFVELAKTPEERERGLMFRKKLPKDHGMLFLYDQDVEHPFWMKNTSISLDILFIDKENKIVFIAQNTEPFSEALITPMQAYRFALEINSGLAESFHIKAGDRISFDPGTSK